MYHQGKENCNWRNRKRNSSGEEKPNRDEILSGYFERNYQKPEIAHFDLCRTGFR
jgi:hypothetical protein